MLWSLGIAYGLQNEFSASWLFWRINSTWRCTMFLGPLICIDQDDDHSVLPTQPSRGTASLKLAALSNRAFAVAAPHVWTVYQLTSSQQTHCQLLSAVKMFLFQQSYPDIVYWHYPSVVLAVAAPLRPLQKLTDRWIDGTLCLFHFRVCSVGFFSSYLVTTCGWKKETCFT